jgi:RimJ/RimL family protein N-acetyltransferase
MLEHSPPVSVPRLRTPRLNLREYRASDFPAFAAHLADPRSTLRTGGAVDRRTAGWLFGSNMGEWILRGAGWWAIELRASGTFVGTVGAFFRETWPEIEMGWNTFSAHAGQGVATEAATEVVRYLFEVRKEPRVTALIDATNAPSLRVAAHLGMTYEAEVDFFGKPIGRYVRASVPIP